MINLCLHCMYVLLVFSIVPEVVCVHWIFFIWIQHLNCPYYVSCVFYLVIVLSLALHSHNLLFVGCSSPVVCGHVFGIWKFCWYSSMSAYNINFLKVRTKISYTFQFGFLYGICLLRKLFIGLHLFKYDMAFMIIILHSWFVNFSYKFKRNRVDHHFLKSFRPGFVILNFMKRKMYQCIQIIFLRLI